ncbi:MAG: iron-sulfur cluster insertion protein ErpA [Legionellales bacterium RIFCSPHIGHO2_12_FULL_37_14]|nr:MAG: iron-sulfur cluster insertion protein ErpA [Legionellales bacterium RIFCSPHIGHO2_12_FULL_37_14]
MQNRNTPHFTVSAADKVNSLSMEESNHDLHLRVYITGGGCSGYQYGFTFDDKVADDDWVIEQRCSDQKTVVKVLIDSMCYPYLKTAEIDYVRNIEGEHFVIRNPAAKTTCGCGASFSIEQEEHEQEQGDGHG